MLSCDNPNHRNAPHAPGAFTLTEVIVSVSMFLIMAGVGVGAYFRYYSFALVDLDITNTMTLIDQARFVAQKNANSSDYGIHLDPVAETLTQFQSAYVPNASGNVVLKLGTLGISDLNLNPAPGVTRDILFQRQTGKTVNWGTFKIGNGDYAKTFSINPEGVVE
jgi:type II secretory pathway pseudopilin PulG